MAPGFVIECLILALLQAPAAPTSLKATLQSARLHHQCYYADIIGPRWDGQVVKFGGPEFCGLPALSDAEMMQLIADIEAQLPNRAREPQVLK